VSRVWHLPCANQQLCRELKKENWGKKSYRLNCGAFESKQEDVPRSYMKRVADLYKGVSSRDPIHHTYKCAEV
jgi:hypothetical protein